MDTTQKVRRNIWLTHDLNAATIRAAREMGISVNALVVMALSAAVRPDQTRFNPLSPSPSQSQPSTIQAPEHRFKKKKKKPPVYIPPDYVMQDDGDDMPLDARPLPWPVLDRIATYIWKHPDAAPRTIASALGIPMWQATVGHQAYETGWVGEQLDQIEASKKKGAV